MVCSVLSGGVRGIESFPVCVETDISNGMPCFDIVGYVGNEVKEAKDRVRTAMKNEGYSLPVARITVNLSPGDVKKSGTGFDLPVALSILACMDVIPTESLNGLFVAGELSLSGQVSHTKGILPMILAAKARGIGKCMIPAGNSKEGAVVEGVDVYAVDTLSQAVSYLQGRADIRPVENHLRSLLCTPGKYEYDFAAVRGQKVARRGAEIAAAGLHNMIMTGPPGAGKSLIAKCIPSIMPPLSEDECLEVSAVYSVRGELGDGMPLVTKRPFVAAHSSSTDISLVGGGTTPRPGAVSLAHKGVLFLDEIPEFSRKAIEALRQPLEDGRVHITRNRDICTFPADFMLVAAMNPCPCGYYPDMNRCTCDDAKRSRYMSRISGPFLDRMDICVVSQRVSPFDILEKESGESSADIRRRVIAAADIQTERFRHLPVSFNSQMGNDLIEKFCELASCERELMRKLADRHQMSARTYYRVLKVARTIADLSGQERIDEASLMEAVRFKVSFD